MEVPSSVIERCKQGDQDAFEELIRLTHRAVYSLALRLVGDPEDAADITQETYLKLLRVIRQFRGEAKFSTWLYRVASSVAISTLRRKSRRRMDLSLDADELDPVSAAPSADPALATERQLLKERLDRALQMLPASYRVVAVMKDVYGLSFEEIAEQLHITEGTARVRLHRARRRLRELLGGEAA
ncbi:MAG: sigma-70 family RNA polymerase sigma factor [Actinomycetota bacterium]|nr:sigma-70 family RNA polymerase sigma factor [Actinomycetota bacterium]